MKRKSNVRHHLRKTKRKVVAVRKHKRQTTFKGKSAGQKLMQLKQGKSKKAEIMRLADRERLMLKKEFDAMGVPYTMKTKIDTQTGKMKVVVDFQSGHRLNLDKNLLEPKKNRGAGYTASVRGDVIPGTIRTLISEDEGPITKGGIYWNEKDTLRPLSSTRFNLSPYGRRVNTEEYY